MARVVVPYSDFHTGKLPHVCCVTGEATDRLVKWRFVQVPSWTWMLIFFGFFPWLLIRALSTEDFFGTIPITERAHSRVRKLSRAMLAFGPLTVLFVIVALFTAPWVAVLAGLSALGWVVSVAVGSWWSPDARHEAHEVVIMRNVHPEFVGAVEALRRRA